MFNLNQTAVNYGEWLSCEMRKMFFKDPTDSTVAERFEVLVSVLKEKMSEALYYNEKNYTDEKEVHYFSMEFLLGKQLKSVILNLGLEDEINEAMKNLGWNLEEIVAYEPEPSTGNGGLIH